METVMEQLRQMSQAVQDHLHIHGVREAQLLRPLRVLQQEPM